MDRIRVVADNLMCWPVSAATLEALACSCYDPWARSDPGPEFVETISEGEWLKRKAALRGEQYG